MSENYHFKESQLDPDFCQEKYLKIKKLINSSVSFTIIGMPGVGVSYFLRYLASTDIAYFIFVDMYALSTLSRIEYLRWFLHELGGVSKNKTEQQIYQECKNRLEELSKKYPKIVIIFNRFDQLKEEFDREFLANLRSLKHIAPEKIVMIFTANKPLYEIAEESIIGTNLHFYSSLFYFQTYFQADLQKLAQINIPGYSTNDSRIAKLMKLSGGHNQLFMIMAKSETQENPLLDRFVRLQLKELYEFLSYHQQTQIQKIALRKNLKYVDPFLINTGIVIRDSLGIRLFTPLMEEYTKSYIAFNIPAKEGRLFKLLKQNLGKVVSKDEIFDYIWGKDPNLASDWALNALIYRLRKNPQFQTYGYYIENHKKIGYRLIKT